MIIHVFHLPRYNWDVYAYYGVNPTYKNIIIDQLRDMGCDESDVQKSIKVIDNFTKDTGFTYSNFKRRESVVAVSRSNSSEGFMNTLVHEARHLQQHIQDVYDIEDTSEEIYYLMGKLVQVMYNKAKPLIKSLE